MIAIGTFGPDEIKAIVAAYDGALTDLQLIDRNHPEWNLLKTQFDALVYGEGVDADSIEKTFDAEIRRRFAELINRTAEQPKLNRNARRSRAF